MSTQKKNGPEANGTRLSIHQISLEEFEALQKRGLIGEAIPIKAENDDASKELDSPATDNQSASGGHADGERTSSWGEGSPTLTTEDDTKGDDTKGDLAPRCEVSAKQQKNEGADFHSDGMPEVIDPPTLDKAEQRPAPNTDPRADRWEARGFQDAMKGSQAKPPWIIEDLLLAESATLVSAQPHAMKSLSLLSACLEAVAKKKVWGHFDAKSVDSVLFLETEDPAWMVETRIRGLAKGLGISERDPVAGFHYACVGPFDFLGKENRIEELIQKHAPTFIVLSTLQNLLSGRDYNRQNDMQPVMAGMLKIAQAAPLILVTHSPWDKRQKRAAGSVTQTANFLTALQYEKRIARKTGETFVHVSVDSKAGALETDFSLKLEIDGSPRDPGSVRKVAYIGKGWPKGTGKEAILAEIEEDPDASASEIAERTGMTQRYVQKIFKERDDEKRKARV
jgi:hypothetical protein